MENESEIVKKKRGRKKKVDDTVSEEQTKIKTDSNTIVQEQGQGQDGCMNDVMSNTVEASSMPVVEEDVQKKRGRKPKGGKLTTKPLDTSTQPTAIANIILHLKCSLNDLTDYNNNKIMKDPYEYNPEVPTNIIMTYNDDEDASHYGIYESNKVADAKAYPESAINDVAGTSTSNITTTNTVFCPNCVASMKEDDNVCIRDINTKLKKLKIQLYKNAIPDKKASCFWCTYEFDNQACYIPKYEMDGRIFGYGSFCRPECAVAYLMRENIDDSTKFERYHLLNQIYSKVYGFKKSIKPAPNPYYMLDKYYGNLTIQEYRKLLKTEHMLLVIDKPMTRILPELHEDNEDLMANIYGGTGKVLSTTNANHSGVFKVKRQCDKQEGPSKSSIMKNKFGMA
jgi:hypothetical protein